MKEKIQIAFVTVSILIVGMVLGFWLAWHRPLPHPAWIGGPQFRPDDHRPRFTPEQVEAFRKQIDLLQPELKDFQDRFTALDADFHSKFSALLDDKQKALLSPHHEEPIDWAGDFNRMAEDRVGGPSAPPLESLPGLHPHQNRALMTLIRILMYEPTVRIMTERYQLTPDQQTQLRLLMEQRRQSLITLCQEHPLPLDKLYFSMHDLGLLHDPGQDDHPPGPGPGNVSADHPPLPPLPPAK